jgi:hypothetical protein
VPLFGAAGGGFPVLVNDGTYTTRIFGPSAPTANQVRMQASENGASIPGTTGLAYFEADCAVGNNSTYNIQSVSPTGATGSQITGTAVDAGTDRATCQIVLGGNLMVDMRRTNTGVFKQGFFGQTAVPQPTVTGAKGGNAALGSLLAALSTAAGGLGLLVDSSTA